MKFKNVKKTLYLRGAGTVLTLSLAAGTIAPAAPAFAETQDDTVTETEALETAAAQGDAFLGTEENDSSCGSSRTYRGSSI